MDNGIIVPDSESVISSIKYHAEFTPSYSPEKFELPKAYYATAESVRDTLITNWNATYAFHEKMNVKQAYYLSMEFLQGRALLNAIGNLELSGAYSDALRKLGHDLEDVANQVSLFEFKLYLKVSLRCRFRKRSISPLVGI